MEKKKEKRKPGPKPGTMPKKAKNKTGPKPVINEKQKRFAELLVIEGMQGSEAARQAGYAEKNAGIIAFNLTKKNLLVADYIADLRAKVSMASLATRERVLEELARVAFFDPINMVEKDGRVKNIHDMPEDTRRVISSLEVSEILGDENQFIGTNKKVKTVCKLGGLRELEKILGMIIDRAEIGTHEGQGPPIINVVLHQAPPEG